MSRARDFANLAGSADAGGITGRNRIINGDMRIDQRNAGAAVTVNTGNAFYCMDRYFCAGTSSAGVFTVQQSSTAPVGFNTSSLITVTTSATPSGTDNYRFNQAIEGLNVADLNWGSANAQSVTLSFWVRSSLTGTFGGALQNSDKSRTYPFSYTISSANTWEQKTITIDGDTTGTWLTTNGIGVLVVWCLGAADRLGTANAWSSTRYDGATGQVNLISTNGATFYITGVQLEVGEQATPFEHRNYGDELARCRRYCNVIAPNVAYAHYGFVGFCESSTKAKVLYTFPVEMRATPSFTRSGSFVYDSASANPTFSSVDNIALTSTNCRIEDVVSGGTTGQGVILINDNDASATIKFDAEL